MKLCTKCKTEKELSEYSKKKSSKDGLQYECKACVKQYDKQYRAENSERLKQQRKQYHAKYPEKIKAKNKANRNLPSIRGMHRHHWSYQEKHWLDVIYVDASLHSYYHSKLEYDPERMIYRVKATGQLLDTKQKHSSFLVKLLMHKKKTALK